MIAIICVILRKLNIESLKIGLSFFQSFNPDDYHQERVELTEAFADFTTPHMHLVRQRLIPLLGLNHSK